MANFLFWNLKRKPLTSLIARAVKEHGIDVVLLAECPYDPADFERELATAGIHGFIVQPRPADDNTMLMTLARLTSGTLATVFDDDAERLTAAIYTPTEGESVLIVLAHLASKMYPNDYDQLSYATRVARRIRFIEDVNQTDRTIFVGDMNMNPFDPGVISSDAFHAVMSKSIALEESRIVRGERHRFFYNPMWALLGSVSGRRAYGSYFYRSATPTCFFWNVFDQVLVRPSLAIAFQDVDILTTIDGQDLLKKSNDVPDDTFASDHLPLFFKIELNGETL